ncbi:MAG: TIGR00730 family Rossman fold protein [Meiothermus sp.]|nr:TIGR00730 family Rossman fold protein [Meiothermus sp.]
MKICVFCGSSSGVRSEYLEAARRLGQLLAQERVGLVYGGSRLGLMGEMASACLNAGGQVIGVIPRGLMERELAHQGLTELHVVETMHQRKAMMADLAHAFITLPGGLGTLEELFEIRTWSQLGIHQKPLGLLNVEGYYDKLLGFLWHSQGEGFTRRENLWSLLVDQDPRVLLERLRNYQALPAKQWLSNRET